MEERSAQEIQRVHPVLTDYVKRNPSKAIPIAIKAKYDTKTKKVTMVGDGEQYDVPIAALCLFQIVVTVDEVECEVDSSSWVVMGVQLIGGSVLQNSTTGEYQIQTNPTIAGGYGGDPSVIGTAWIAPGTYGLTITGIFEYDGPQEFSAGGSVVVHAPNYNFAAAAPSIVSTPNILDDTSISVQFATATPITNPPQIAYTCDGIVQNGTIGFLQTCSGLRVRGYVVSGNAQYVQCCGQAETFIDNASNVNLFYRNQPAAAVGGLYASDQPTEALAQPYTAYAIGFDSPEEFDIFVAYQAPTGGSVVESYISIYLGVHWSWDIEATWDGDEWNVTPNSANSTCDNAFNGDWELPTWTNNSLALWNWVPMAELEKRKLRNSVPKTNNPKQTSRKTK